MELAYEGEVNKINKLLNTTKSIDDIFRFAQAAFNKWSRYPAETRTTETLLGILDFDFFEVLDSVTIARSRKHISIMDLGLNEFRLDLLAYLQEHGDVDKVPFGMHALVSATEDIKPGVIYILKNINNGVNIDNRNRLHPFYMVYISNDKEVICNHLQPKKMFIWKFTIG